MRPTINRDDELYAVAKSHARAEDCSMPDAYNDQQPIQRIVGKRRPPPPGALPSAQARAALSAMAQYRTRAPKGVFFYSNHDEMERDRERWTVEAVVANALAHRASSK
jgi:hypothetical protein